MGALLQFLKGLGLLIPHQWLLPILIVAGMAYIPTFLHGIKTRQVKDQVREVARATSYEDRKSQEERAMEMAGGNARLIVAVGDAAVTLNQKMLVQRAIQELERLGKVPDDVRRLRREIVPETPRAVGDPLEALLLIKRLQEEGLIVLARLRLEEARTKFPKDAELAALEQAFESNSSDPT